MKDIFSFVFGLLALARVCEAQEHENIFLIDFGEKVAEMPSPAVEVSKPSEASTVTVTIDFDEVLTRVPKYVFGNNANVYMTQIMDQPVLLRAIEDLQPNVIRYPGGNLSSVFFWNSEAGEPPGDAPAKLVDANGAAIDPGYWYGKNHDSWTLSVDNYYEVLEETNSTGIITINYGYARYGTGPDPVASAAHLAAEWVRYDNGRTKFWEIGNESNGTWQAGHRIDVSKNQDAQPELISGALYGNHFLVFADSMRKAAAEIDHTIYIGAQLLAEEPASWWNDTDRYWNAGVFQQAGDAPDFYIIHSYYTPYQANASPEEVLNSASVVTEGMMGYVTDAINDAGARQKPIALTEWNIFAEGSRQQVSAINGMHAAIVLGELIKNGYGLACRWNLANAWDNGNDHGIFSQGDEPGVPKWHRRPAWYYMYYFQKYFGDHMVASAVTGSGDVLAFASRFSSGETGLVVVNKGTRSEVVKVAVRGFGYGDKYYFHSLTAGAGNEPFPLKVLVNGEGTSLPSGGPDDPVDAWSALTAGGVRFHSPGRSVQYVLIEAGDNVITDVVSGKEPSVMLYPNPAREGTRIALQAPDFSKLEIVNMAGVKVYEREVGLDEQVFEIMPGLPPGVYTVFLMRADERVSGKIIIH